MLRALAPFVLLALGLLALAEPLIPGADAFAKQFGETAVLRVIVAGLAFYCAVLVLERRQLFQVFQETLAGMRDTVRQAGAARDTDRRDALKLLVGALASDDPSVRKTAAENLRRLSGRDHGEDADAWRRALGLDR